MSYSGRALACVLPFSISQPSEALNIMRRILQVLTAAMLVMTVLHRKCGSDLRGSAAASKDGGHWRGIARGHDGRLGFQTSLLKFRTKNGASCSSVPIFVASAFTDS